jgi:hypothetical protein
MNDIIQNPKTLILLNGPKRVGKTTIANTLQRMLNNVQRINMADHVKMMTHAAYGLPLDPDYLEAVKDSPHPAMGGMTPREAYIHFSERVMKELHGSAVFGEVFVNKAKAAPEGSCIITADTGFAGEIVPIAREFGVEHLLLVRLNGLNANFNGDSRSYVYWRDVVFESKRQIHELNKGGKPVPYRIGPSCDLGGTVVTEIDIENIPGQSMRAAQEILDVYRNHVFARTVSYDTEPAN